MLLTTFFTDSGAPATGLSPTIRIRNANTGSLLITDAAMSEIGDGFYSYDFTSYDRALNYAIRADGGGSLDDGERYSYFGNDTYHTDIAAEVWATTVSGYSTTFGEAVALIRQIEIGKWEISSSILTFYDEDGVTPIVSFTLNDPDTPTSRVPI